MSHKLRLHQRAGFALSDAVYFGDAIWDVRASVQLGVRMIGIGRRTDQLQARGIAPVFRDFTDSESIFEAMRGSVKA